MTEAIQLSMFDEVQESASEDRGIEADPRFAEHYRIYRQIMNVPDGERVLFGELFYNWCAYKFPKYYLFSMAGYSDMTLEQVVMAMDVYYPRYVGHLHKLHEIACQYTEVCNEHRQIMATKPINWIAYYQLRQTEWELMRLAESGEWRNDSQA